MLVELSIPIDPEDFYCVVLSFVISLFSVLLKAIAFSAMTLEKK